MVFKFTYPNEEDNNYDLSFINRNRSGKIIGCDSGITHMLEKCPSEGSTKTEFHTLILHATSAESINGTNITCEYRLGRMPPEQCGNFTDFVVLVYNNTGIHN